MQQVAPPWRIPRACGVFESNLLSGRFGAMGAPALAHRPSLLFLALFQPTT